VSVADGPVAAAGCVADWLGASFDWASRGARGTIHATEAINAKRHARMIIPSKTPLTGGPPDRREIECICKVMQ
jgi:hypothetical protein